MSTRVRLLIWMLAIAAVIVALVIGLAPSSSTGREAPALPREQLSGPTATLAGLLSSGHGRPSLVVFWASWCEPCAREAAAIERFSKTPTGRGRIVGVDWNDALSGARAFIRQHAWTFSNVRDGLGSVGYAYHLSNLPTTFVIGSDGRIRATLHGPQTEQDLQEAFEHPGSV
jgi:thiol-disulfide isomerase/thioredoxin